MVDTEGERVIGQNELDKQPVLVTNEAELNIIGGP